MKVDGVLSESIGGTLQGAYAPPLEGVPLPDIRLTPSKVYTVDAPVEKCTPGTQFLRNINGEMVLLTVPEGFDPLKAGRFKYTHVGDVDKVIATTLPMVPGYDVALSKPIVFGCETIIFDDRGYSGKPTLAKTIAKLTQDAQNQVNSLAIEHACNAVLSVQFNVAMSHLPNGKACKVAVSCFGTPCVIVPSATVLKNGRTTNDTLYTQGTSTDDRTVHTAYTEATGHVNSNGDDQVGDSATEEEEAGSLPSNIGGPQRKISTLENSPHHDYPPSDDDNDGNLPENLFWSEQVHDRARMTLQSGHIPDSLT